MEELCYRFPVIGELVLNNLDEQSLSNCQEASRVISQFVIKERLFWIRIIQKYYKNLSEFKRYWEMIIHQTSAGILKQLAFSNSGIYKVAMVKNALLPMSLYSLLWVDEIIRYHLHIVDRSTMCK